MNKNYEVVIDESTYEIAMCSNVSISELEFNGTKKEIKFYLHSHSGTIGFCNISIPKKLLGGEIAGYKDDSLLDILDYNQTQTTGQYSFHISFEQNTHCIRIISSEAILEFPTWTPILLSCIALIITIALYKPRLTRKQFLEES